ncbi:3-hydroxybenzoate--CoA/4-hydroxybenzoate--CoA ligase [mine drainage metagenome]|uniref:3-hydroxybenzoate--CoA/4-hydroxybenzoate--CoA ligase n=1 Tax=mine drainage metagenome TaxID=410659 RepID=A0A1J5S3P7_9ZZZZ
MAPVPVNAAACLFETGAADHIALECGSQQISYGELRRNVARAAAAWQSLGLRADDRVVVFAPDGIDWVEVYLGAIWAGGVAVGINPRLGLADLAGILEESVVRFVWTTPALVAEVAAMAAALPQPPLVLAAAAARGSDLWTGWQAEAFEPIDPAPRLPQDMALWIGTSGTTGKPKGVIHTQGVAAPCAEFARQILGAGAEDRLYATSKLFFAYALANSLFAGLRLGATVILDPEWPTPERVLEMVAAHRPTMVLSVPTLYNKMLVTGIAARLKPYGIRYFVSAGESLPASVCERWREVTGVAPVSSYGTSETLSLMLYAQQDTGLLRPTPLTEVRYGDLDADLPQRIWLRHPGIARGYWQRPKESEADFKDGWFSPGDMFLRRDGELEFAGRNDDLLKIAGQWVSTQWVEQALREACGDVVQELAAVGVKGADGLTAIALFLVPSPQTREEAQRRLELGIAGLAGHKRPRWIHWVEALPQTATGKLQRARLSALHQERLPEPVSR